MGIRVRDDRNGKTVFFYIKYGKADAIQADGAFFNDKTCEFFIYLKTVFPTTIFFYGNGAGSGGIYMALHNMPV